MADQDIQGMLVRIEATTAQLRQELQRAEAAVGKASTGIDKDLSRVDDAFDRAGESAAGMESTVTSAMAGVSVAATGALAGLVALTAQTASAADEIKNLAFVSNAGVVEFQRQAAAARSVGVEQDKLADIYKDVNDKLGEFIREGGGEMKAFFETIAPKIGVTVDQLKTLSGPQVLQTLYNAMEKAGLSQQLMTTYLEEFADEATALIPLLRNNGQGFKDMGDQAERLGQVLSAVDIDRLSALNGTINQLKGSVQGASNELVMAMLPAIQAVTDDLNQLSTNGAFTTLGEGIGFLIENLDVMTVLLGGTAAAAMTRYTMAVLESGVAIGKKSLATVEATRADLAAASAANAAAAADKAAALAELDRLRSVQAALAAEKALEVERLKAQISDIGRQQSVARMAELRLAEVAVTRQQEVAERALASATAASQAVASRWATVGQGMLSLLGGPVGLVSLVVSAGLAFLTLRDNTDKSAQALEELKRPLDEVIAKYRQLNQDQQKATLVKWTEAQGAAAKAAAEEYDELVAAVRRGFVGPRANAASAAAFRELKNQLDAARSAGEALTPILERAGVPEGVRSSWIKQAGTVAEATKLHQDATAKIAAVKAATEQGAAATRASGSATGAVNAAVEGYLKTLDDETQKIKDLSEREQALIWLKEQKIAVESEDGKRVLEGAEAADKAKEAKEAEKKAEQEATKAKNAGASASKQAAKQLSDYRAETELATSTALKQADAYLKGEEAVAQLARQEEIERQVLKLGEQARADVTQRVNEYYDAVERRDLSKQTHELSREVDQLQAQAVATLAGRDALDEYNDAKAMAIALAGKNIDAQGEEARALEEAIQKNREAAQVLEQVSQANGIMDRLLPETRLLREYTEEQDALNKAIELYPAKADQYREALRRLGIEYEQNRTESSAWGQWTQDALERVDSAFADMWKGVGDGFGSFADGLKSAFSQLLAELAHMAITRPIIVQIGSALGIGGLAGQSSGLLGSLGGGSGGGSGLLGSLSSAYSLYQSGSGNGLLGSVWSGLKNDGITGAWNGLTGYGSSLFSGLDAAGGQLIGSLGGTSSMTYAPLSWQMSNGSSALGSVASWAGPLAGAFAGYQAGGLGGAAVGGLGAWGGAAAGTAIGTAIGGTLGSVLPGIGTAIGAAIGSWAGGKLFGGSGERFKETYTTSSGYYDYGSGYVDTGDLPVFSGRRQFGDDYDAYLSDVNQRFVTTVGGLFDTFTDGTAYVQSDIAARLRRTSGKIAADLWANVDAEPMHFKRSYGGDGKNIPGALEAFANDVMGEWLAQTIVNSDDLPQYLRDQFGDLAKDKDTTPEEVQARIAEIIGRFEGVNSVLELVGISALDATDAGLRAGDAIVELAGGIEQLQSAVGVYYDQFYSESEKISDSLQNIPDTFAQAGVELPSIRAEYRAMVEDIDVTTAAGQSMFATMMSLAGSADAYYDLLEAKAAAAEQAAAEAAAALLQSELNYYDLFTASAVKTEDALAGVRAQFAALSVSLPDTRAGFAQAIEALDLTTESGRSMYETMLGLASAADSYYDTLEARAAAAAEAQAAEVGEEEGLLDRLRESRIALAEATGDTAMAEALRAEILQEERNALYAANRALHDQIQAVNAQAAAQAAAEAAAASAEAEQAYYAAFTSAAQQQRDSIAEVTEAFEAAGVVLPTSREQFAALVESIDTGTASGQQLRQVLIGLADDADTAYTALEAMRESARSAVDAAISTGQQAVREAQQAVMDAYQAEASGLDSVIATFERFTESLRDFRGELGDAALEMQAPDRQLAELRRQFDAVAAAAAGGDRQAMAELPEIGGRLAEAAREMSSSREDYLRQLAYLDSETASAELAAGEQVSVAQQQLDALNAQLAALELAGEAQQSFADAVLQLLQAQMEADRLLSEAERQALSVEMRWLSGALTAPLGAGGAIVAALSAGFDAIDMNTDGLLDQSELRAALVETGLLSEADLPAVAAMLDRNRDGVISAIEAQDALLDAHAIAAGRNFAALDSSLDGLLDQAELKAALVDTGLLTRAELDTLLVRLDANNDGLIDAQEATGAAISAAAALLRGGLETIDTSLDGLLDRDELQAALVDTGLLTGAELDRLIAAVDTNGDGLIDAIEQGNLDLIAQFGQYADDVSSVYREVLGRDADAPGLDYWADLIESGAISVDKLVDAILAGAAGTEDQAAAAAYANSVVDSAYQDILGRSADAPSLDYWSAALQSGAIAVGSLPEVIAASAVNGAAGSDRDAAMGYIDDIVGSAYQAVLGREADAAGKEWWSSLLGSGRVQFEDFPGIFAVSAFSGPDGADKTKAARYLGIPGYASGGDFGGGLRLVGERGPELEVTGPSRIYSAAQTADLLSGGAATAEALGGLQQAIDGLRDGIRSIAKHTMKTAKLAEFLERWEYDGLPETRTA